jgi:Tfp pilus assembly ATPase PilU
MVLELVKNVAKKAFSKKGAKSNVLTLDQILDMPYVKEVMSKTDIANIKKYYTNAPEEAKVVLCEKLKKIDAVYKQFENEKDPLKRKNMMFKAVKEGMDQILINAKKAKKDAVKTLEDTEHVKDVEKVEEKLSNL